MSPIWFLVLLAVYCTGAPADLTKRNVFPPYKPIFSPEVLKELQEIFNISNGLSQQKQSQSKEQIIQTIVERAASNSDTVLYQVYLGELGYNEILAILGDYFKGL